MPLSYLFFGVAEIIGEVYQIKLAVYIFKPLLMPCLLVYLLSQRRFDQPFPFVWGAIALIMSWFGDIFLMLDPQFFVLGLGSFLMAQVAYIIVYGQAVVASGTKAMRSWTTYLILGCLLAYGIFLIGRILPQLGELLLPVLVYALSLLGM